MNELFNRWHFSIEVIIGIIFILFVSFLSIGYSAFYSSLDIKDVSAVVRVQKDIRVTGVVPVNTTGNAISYYEEYDVNNINSSVSLPNSNSSVTYNVIITNVGNVEMGILDVSGLPSNLTYSISNFM